MTMRSLTLAALLAFALAAVPVATGQTAPRGTSTDPGITNASKQRALTNARKSWKSRSVPSYTYLLSVNCYCPPTTGVKIVVRKGLPSPKTPRELKDQATVPRLFRTIQKAIDDKAAKLVVTYGPRGVPRSIYIDADERIADEEVGYLVRGFAPLKR
jgi:hypothetical protein